VLVGLDIGVLLNGVTPERDDCGACWVVGGDRLTTAHSLNHSAVRVTIQSA
jgi:hypothetical protein